MIPLKPSIAVRLQRAITRLATLALLAAAGIIAAKYVICERLDEGIRARVETELRRNYPALDVHVKSARRVQGKGIEIRGLVIAQPSAKGGQTLLQVSEVLAECDTGFPDFVAEDPKFRRFQVRGMKVRAERTASGTWNLASLLPLPKHAGPSPPAEIKEATLELVDEHAGGGGNYVLRDIELTVNPQLRPKENTDSLLSIKGSLGGDHLERIEIDALLDPVSGQWDLRGRVEGLEFNPRMRAALPRELSAVLQPLASVRGRTQFGFHVTRGGGGKNTQGPPLVQFSIDGQIAEGRIDDSRLPDPLTDVTASIHCDNRVIRIDDLSGRCGQTIVESLSAELRGYGPNSPVNIRLKEAKNIDLSRVPVASLPAAVREAWGKFSPRGRINLSGTIAFDGRAWHPALTADCLDLSLLYKPFPYRVSDGTGTIQLAQNRLTANLRFVGGGQKLLCTADIFNPGNNYLGSLELKSAGPLVLEEGIIAALEEKSQNIVRDFNPRGHISFAGRVERQLEQGTVPPRAVEHRYLTVQLHDMAIQHEKFAYPIEKVTGKLEYIDGNWTFSELAGRNDSATITGSGYWVTKAKDGNQLFLEFHASDVAFEEELRLALSASIQNLWTNLRPRGTIDQLVVRMKYNPAAAKFGVELDAHKRREAASGPVSIEPAWFRYRLDDLSGDFYYRDGMVTLENIEAMHGKTKVSTQGTCRTAGGMASVQLKRLTADHIEFDQELLAALPRSLGSALARLSPAGQINMNGALNFALPSEGTGPQLDWDMKFVFSGGSLQVGLKVEHLDGDVRLVGHSDGRNLLCHGELDIASAMLNDLQVTSIKGPLLIDSQQLLAGMWAERDPKHKAPRFITARVFGDGELSLDGQLKFSPAGDFLIQTSLDQADLATIVADLQPSVRGVTGKVSGAVSLRGTTEGVHTWQGEGQVKLTDAYLYELPTMVSVLQVLSIQRPDRNAFTESNMEFKIEGDDLEFTHLDLNGGVISLKGKGRLTGRRDLDLKFYTQIGRGELQIFRPLVGDVNRQFMLIEVTGPLEHPISRKTAFPKLNENLQKIFPELASDDRNMSAPVPRSIFSAPREAMERMIPKRK